MAKAKSRGEGRDAGALIGAAFPHRELLVMAAAIKLAEASNFKPPERAALKRVFAKLQKAHLWQAKHSGANKSPKAKAPAA